VSDGEFSRLHGLELLPINNGTFSVFGNRNQYSQVIICKDEIDLFPGQDEKFVPCTASITTLNIFITQYSCNEKHIFTFLCHFQNGVVDFVL
jgi:hypothetical protein